MTTFDLSKIKNASFLPGLRKLNGANPITGSTTMSGTIASGGSKTGSITLTFPRTNVLSVVRVNVTGGSFGSYWFPLQGSLGLYDFANNFYLLFIQQGSSSGRTIKIEAVNETASSSITLPSLTISVAADIYDYPF